MRKRPFAMVPLPGARSSKPRRSGLTMIVDAGFATQGERALGRFYSEARRLGFEALEISDNVVPLSAAERKRQIRAVMIELPGPWIPEVRKCDVEALKKLLIEALGPDVNLANVAPEARLRRPR